MHMYNPRAEPDFDDDESDFDCFWGGGGVLPVGRHGRRVDRKARPHTPEAGSRSRSRSRRHLYIQCVSGVDCRLA